MSLHGKLALVTTGGRVIGAAIEPVEVAAAVAILCTDEARGIHGQSLVIDGGQVLK